MSTEGAAQVFLKYMQQFVYGNYFQECRTFGAHFYSDEMSRIRRNRQRLLSSLSIEFVPDNIYGISQLFLAGALPIEI